MFYNTKKLYFIIYFKNYNMYPTKCSEHVFEKSLTKIKRVPQLYEKCVMCIKKRSLVSKNWFTYFRELI